MIVFCGHPGGGIAFTHMILGLILLVRIHGLAIYVGRIFVSIVSLRGIGSGRGRI